MTERDYGKSFGGSAPENYQRYFVPVIGAPLAAALVEVAAPAPGERVLDVACGTGVVTRLVAERVGATGTVAALDVSPGMLAVARSLPAPAAPVEWHESSAESLPFADDAFDLVTCQMGLQFVPDQRAALREQHRVLAPGGRVAFNLPGPTPPLFRSFADALTRHVDPRAGGFMDAVFALHDADAIRVMTTEAGFDDVRVEAEVVDFALPAPATFLWQYVHSTPLASIVGEIDPARRQALERDVDGDTSLAVRVTTVTARA